MIGIADLNESQRNAVEWNQGPLLVIAGPGSGKTRVLTTRVARLIRDTAPARFPVLGLTFTTKATEEMRRRVATLLDGESSRARLMTFHSFCVKVLRIHGSHLGLTPNFDILSQPRDRLGVLNEAIERLNDTSVPSLDRSALLGHVERLMRRGYDGGLDRDRPAAVRNREWLAPVYDSYLETLVSENQLDFAAVQVCCVRLFRRRPEIAQHYRTIYPYVCVDEFQDTDRCQYLLLSLLCPPRRPNLFVVADIDQAIYQWRGSDPELVDHLLSDYDVEIIQLPESYRCPPEVMSLANKLIGFNRRGSITREPGRSYSAVREPEAVRIQSFPDESAEASWIARDVLDRGAHPSDTAVLARNHRLLNGVSRALGSMGLSVHIPRQLSSFETPLMRFVCAALRVTHAPQDREEARTLRTAFHDLTGVVVRGSDVEAESAVGGGSLLRGFVQVAGESGAEEKAGPLLASLRDDLLERLRYRDFSTAAINWFRSLEGGAVDSVAREEREEVEIWHDMSRRIRRRIEEPTLSEFLQELDRSQMAARAGPDDVHCLTIHLSKGKEFRHVYLMGMAEDQLPSYRAKQKGEGGGGSRRNAESASWRLPGPRER